MSQILLYSETCDCKIWDLPHDRQQRIVVVVVSIGGGTYIVVHKLRNAYTHVRVKPFSVITSQSADP